MNAIFGDEVIEITLSEVTGTNSIWWNVNIGTRVYGAIRYRFGEWLVEFSRDSQFCYEDGQAMIELVARHYPNISNKDVT